MSAVAESFVRLVGTNPVVMGLVGGLVSGRGGGWSKGWQETADNFFWSEMGAVGPGCTMK